MEGFSHILINSYIRCGGSLLARLLDGHPSLIVSPLEMQYSKEKVFWPYLDPFLTSRDFSGIVEEMSFFKFERQDERGRLSKDLYGKGKALFSYTDFLEGVRDGLKGEETWDMRKVINSVGTSFFRCWDGGLHYPRDEEIKYFVNHLTMMFFADPVVFFDAFPDGYIVQTVRDPRAWYASVKGHYEVSENHPIFLPSTLLMWIESTMRAIVNSRFFVGRYLLVRYEDMVLDTEQKMRELCHYFGLEYNEILLQPTLGGRSWKGNSSFGPKHGVDANSLKKWIEHLTSEESEKIEKECKDLLRLLGYDSDDIKDMDIDADAVNIPSLKTPLFLTMKEESERLREETRRISAITWQIFRGVIMENFSGRFIKRRKKGVVSRVKKGIRNARRTISSMR